MFDGELKAIKKAGFDVRELTPYQTLLEFLKKEIVPEVKPPEEPKELWKPWWAKIGGGIRTEPEER